MPKEIPIEKVPAYFIHILDERRIARGYNMIELDSYAGFSKNRWNTINRENKCVKLNNLVSSAIALHSKFILTNLSYSPWDSRKPPNYIVLDLINYLEKRRIEKKMSIACVERLCDMHLGSWYKSKFGVCEITVIRFIKIARFLDCELELVEN